MRVSTESSSHSLMWLRRLIIAQQECKQVLDWWEANLREVYEKYVAFLQVTK